MHNVDGPKQTTKHSGYTSGTYVNKTFGRTKRHHSGVPVSPVGVGDVVLDEGQDVRHDVVLAARRHQHQTDARRLARVPLVIVVILLLRTRHHLLCCAILNIYKFLSHIQQIPSEIVAASVFDSQCHKKSGSFIWIT